jgi:hypothetical protein
MRPFRALRLTDGEPVFSLLHRVLLDFYRCGTPLSQKPDEVAIEYVTEDRKKRRKSGSWAKGVWVFLFIYLLIK